MKLLPTLRRLNAAIIPGRMPGFDPLYYRYWYRDVEQFSAGPLAHYLQCGWKEGRDPSAGFSTLGYLAANPDIKAMDVCPLVHFLETGFAEGRKGYLKDPKTAPPIPRGIVPPKLLTGPKP